MKSQIDALTAKFAADIEAVVRKEMMASLQQAMSSWSGGGAPAKGAPAAKAEATTPQKAAGGTAKKKAAAKGKRIRRSPEQIKAAADKIHAYVRQNPNSNAEKIKKALGIAANEWSLPVGELLAGGRLLAKGEKRSTTYTAK